MEIEVTQTNIDEADFGCGGCPIACAVRDKFPEAIIRVGMLFDMFHPGPDRPIIQINDTKWEMESSAIEFMKAFDTGRPVKPTTIRAEKTT